MFVEEQHINVPALALATEKLDYITDGVLFQMMYQGLSPSYSPVSVDVETIWDVKSWGAAPA